MEIEIINRRNPQSIQNTIAVLVFWNVRAASPQNDAFCLKMQDYLKEGMLTTNKESS